MSKKSREAVLAQKRKRSRERYYANIEESRKKCREAWHRRSKEKRHEYAALRFKNRTPLQIAKDKIRGAKRRIKKSILAATDPDFYSKLRACQRVYNLRHKNKTRKRKYRALWSMRIPDWATKGSVLDARSQFLYANLTPSQRAFARELAIEQKERKNQ